MKIPYQTKTIEINIPDVINAGTILKRKAKLFTMTYNQHAEYVALNWIVSFYSDDNGEYGASLSGVIPDYIYESIADNSTAVNPETGEIIFPVETITPAVLDENGNEITPASSTYDVDFMGQYDWFNMLAENQPIQVHRMIEQYGASVTNWDK